MLLLIALLAAGLVLVALFAPAAAPIAPLLYLLATALIAASLGWWYGRRAPIPQQADARSAPTATVAARDGRATLGRYRIERELGRGAMGAVYLGLDPQIGRQVAIKTMALGQIGRAHV